MITETNPTNLSILLLLKIQIIAMKTTDFKLVLNDQVLTRNVDAQKHFFIKFRAYAFDESELKKYAGKWHTLRIITNGGTVYTIQCDDFYNNSFLNNEYGKVQRLIGVADMKAKKGKRSMVSLPTHFYNELKSEAKRRNQPMNSLLEIKPDVNG
jgi:hypothetical protein